MMPSGASRLASVWACCSASSSVGAINAAWKSFSTASSIAKSATIVLPVPTSPMRRRCIRSGAVMSAVTSRTARFWSSVSSYGSAALSADVSSRRTSKAMPLRCRLARVRARTSISCRSKSSSNASRRRPRSASATVAGPVHVAQGVGQRREGEFRAERRRQHVLDEADQRVEMPVHQPADDLVAQPVGGRIDRQHPAPLGAQLLAGVGQDEEFPRRELAAVIEPHGARHEQRLPDLDGAVEKGLPGPGALEHARGVAQHGAEDPEPAAGRDDALVHHPADAGDLVADPRLGHRADGGRVEIAMGEVPEEVLRGDDAEPCERLGPSLPDPLQELDGGVEAE